MLNVHDFELILLEDAAQNAELHEKCAAMMAELCERQDKKLDAGLDMSNMFEDWRPNTIRSEFNKFVQNSHVGHMLAMSACVHKETKEVVGLCGLSQRFTPDFDIMLDGFDIVAPDYRGQGYGAITMAHLMAQAEDLASMPAEADDIEIEGCTLSCLKDNPASMRRLDKMAGAGLIEQTSEGSMHVTFTAPLNGASLDDYAAALSSGKVDKTLAYGAGSAPELEPETI